jgi:hypothetical protein
MQQTAMDKEVLSLLDIIGSSIVDTFYNHLYDKAVHMKERSNRSITECYKVAVATYLKSDDSPMYYKGLIESIQFYTKMATCYDDISYMQCINIYAKLFVPDQYFMSMTETQKTNMLFMVLKESIKEFSMIVLMNHISPIIDDHMNQDNVVILQNQFLEILVKHREQSYSKFIKVEQKKPVVVSTKSVKKNPNIINFSKKYKQCVEAYNALKTKHEDLKSRYDELSSKGKEVQGMFLDQIHKYKAMELQLNKAVGRCATLEQMLKQVSKREPKVETIQEEKRESDSSDSEPEQQEQFGIDYSNDFTFESPMYVDEDM